MPTAILPFSASLENLTLHRGGRQVFDNFSFSVESGEIVLLTGANGAGKTTLLLHLAGLLPPAPARMPPCHVVGTRDAVKTHLTVEENLMFWHTLWGGAAQDVDTAIDQFGLCDLRHMAARLLSSGQRQRVALARLLLVHRPLWLLDEAFTALDAQGRTALIAALRTHLDAGGSAILATHDADDMTRHFPQSRELRLGAA